MQEVSRSCCNMMIKLKKHKTQSHDVIHRPQNWVYPKISCNTKFAPQPGGHKGDQKIFGHLSVLLFTFMLVVAYTKQEANIYAILDW